jgi:hypothetical protein
MADYFSFNPEGACSPEEIDFFDGNAKEDEIFFNEKRDLELKTRREGVKPPVYKPR